MANITAWVKKVWKDRKTEYPTRRTLTKTNGSQEIVTVARNEGNVSQEGDAFSAANMNDLEERIDAGFTELNGKLGNFDFRLKTKKLIVNTDDNGLAYLGDDIQLVFGVSTTSYNTSIRFFKNIYGMSYVQINNYEKGEPYKGKFELFILCAQ